MSYKNINPMLLAIDEAEKASLRDEVPVGAAIYDHALKLWEVMSL